MSGAPPAADILCVTNPDPLKHALVRRRKMADSNRTVLITGAAQDLTDFDAPKLAGEVEKRGTQQAAR